MWGPLLSLISVGCSLIAPAHAASSPDSALDAYQRGNFRSAQAQYSQLAKQQAEDVRLRFNAGAAAYKNNDLTNATAWFESAAGAPDLKLQQQAYYNLGNTRYRLGETTQDPQARMKEWEQSLQHYGSALKLDLADTNAAANLAFVQQALEQLKQQMPQQPQQGKDDKNKKEKKDESKDQPGQQQEQDKDQSGDKKEQQQEPKDQPAKSGEQKDDDQAKGDQSQDKDAGKDQQQGQDKQSQQPEDGQESKAQKGQKSGDESGRESSSGEGESVAEPPGKPGEMSPVQAERLLDQQKGEEKALIFKAAGGGKEAAQRQRRKMKQW